MAEEKVKADLHNHLRTSSHFQEEDFNRAVDITYEGLGQGGILGLANFNDSCYEDFSGLGLRGYDRENIGNAVYVPEKDILIVKGQEVPTNQGHLLVLCLQQRKHLKTYRSLEDTLKEAKDNNGIIIADHPFYREGIGYHLEQHPELLESFDAIEVHNGEAVWIPKLAPKNANKKAREFYLTQKRNHPHLGALSTSDGHSFYEVGRNYTLISEPAIETPEKLTESLRKSVREAFCYDTSQHTSTLGAIDHLLDLAVLAGLSKLGIKR